jgi:phosphohistidine phosphatase
MRRLTLIRHAKSSWDDISLDDFDRPLNSRGLLNAPMMGALLAEHKTRFDLMISSPALRAITTAKLIANEIDYPHSSIQKEASIYESTIEALLTVIHTINDKYTSVALIGHNPGISGLTYHLSQQSILSFPTCAIAELELSADRWSDASTKSGDIKRYNYPKKYTTSV